MWSDGWRSPSECIDSALPALSLSSEGGARLAADAGFGLNRKTADHHQAEFTRNIFRRLRASHSSAVSLIRLELSPELRG
jgi:hypothetical protein